MMHFDFSDEQTLLRKTTRQFVDEKIMPYIANWDREGAFDPSVLHELAKSGFMGVCIPEAYGGSGMDYNELAIICEELERGDNACRTSVSVHTGLNSMTLQQCGNEAQQQ